jgi:hypothetical protein
MVTKRAARDQERRQTIERYHRLKDLEGAYELAEAATTDPDERQRLMDQLAADRQAHREQDVKRGKRPAGGGVMLQQVMWARWIEIAVEHELLARQANARILEGDTHQLVFEFRNALVAVAAAASTIESIVEEVKYLIPEQPAGSKTAAEVNGDVITEAFGLDAQAKAELTDELGWLFDKRNAGVHPYSEPEEPQMHTAGVNTSAEASRFNAAEGGKAVTIALKVLTLAASPATAHRPWITRWATERDRYHLDVVEPLRRKRDTAQPTVQGN